MTNTERNQSAFPPYNIELLEKDKYRITMAVAGFTEEDIELQSENNTLTVAANKAEKVGETTRNYLLIILAIMYYYYKRMQQNQQNAGK